MAISELSLHGIRNVNKQVIRPSSGINLIFGDNGSGKTTLLEAIYLLGRAKSFRTHLLKQLIVKDGLELTVVGQFFDDSKHRTASVIGFQYHKETKAKVRLDGANLRSSAELAKHFPLLYIGSDTGRLLSSGERQRRRCLDWGVFHVEHSFLKYWQSYNKILKQRNVALQLGNLDVIRAWDIELAVNAMQIDLCRQRYFDLLRPLFLKNVEEYLKDSVTVARFSYERGWSKEYTEYSAYLEDNLDKDMSLNYTQRGPHRADIKIDIEQGSMSNYGSGGQQKLITCLLLLSQVELYQQINGRSCVILVDDLPAELDLTFRSRLIDILGSLKTQVFITGTERSLVDLNEDIDKKMFHVKHGEISEVN